MIYYKYNPNVMFILPTMAVGTDTDGLFFFEIGFLCWSVGIG